MAHKVLFLPGIMGSNLDLPDGERVWPPKPREVVMGYKRVDKLQSPDAKPAGVITKVACFGFYNTILRYFDELGFKPDSADKQLLTFDYDWRRDLFDIAEHVADRLTQELGQMGDDDRLSIVGHSMGGLIGRLVLETGKYDDRNWFANVDLFVTCSTPHLGAPLALVRTLGLDSAMGISGDDYREMAKNADYPSGYQLLPAPGEDACWDISDERDIAPLDIYDPETAKSLGLDPDLVARAKAVHDAFAAGKQPDHVRYFYFGGTGHKTVSRVNVMGFGSFKPRMTKVQTRGAGDGTVPIWSSYPRSTQKHTVVNEHSTVFRGDSFRNVMFAIFGKMVGPLDLESVRALGVEAASGEQVPTFSMAQHVHHLSSKDEGIEIVIDSADGLSELDMRLVTEAVDEDMAVTGKYRDEVPLGYSGPRFRTLTIDLDMPDRPGFYAVKLEALEPDGQAFELAEPIPFSVAN